MESSRDFSQKFREAELANIAHTFRLVEARVRELKLQVSEDLRSNAMT